MEDCLEEATLTYASRDRVDGAIIMEGYSDSLVAKEHFALRILAGLDPASSAPFLGAGITTVLQIGSRLLASGVTLAYSRSLCQGPSCYNPDLY